jgi:hypothetical protein
VESHFRLKFFIGIAVEERRRRRRRRRRVAYGLMCRPFL